MAAPPRCGVRGGAGVHGLIVAGTTGEYYAQTPEERIEMMSLARDLIRGRVPMIVGTGAIRTEDSIMYAEAAVAAGADALEKALRLVAKCHHVEADATLFEFAEQVQRALEHVGVQTATKAPVRGHDDVTHFFRFFAVRNGKGMAILGVGLAQVTNDAKHHVSCLRFARKLIIVMFFVNEVYIFQSRMQSTPLSLSI